MITFSRSSLVGAEFPDDETVRFHGVQEDHIYDMEIEVDVRIPDGEILRIKGWMKRYTTPVCPKAVDVLQTAVGMSIREDGWDSRIMREIGRKGCEHFAEILIECGRSFDQARMARDLYGPVMQDPTMDQNAFTANWVNEHPEIQGTCMARK
ncbi:MAG: DUF2889 domain-containing protein [Deltaproteobacteria bacterium]|nr:DUF2889 domain-containing protein [Deltaproteobacteria bacterium]MBW2052387.1 DUF2889 domain-containing protein [Deltaproteobacteria bacterium]MBW2140989.1 DUF2889 domain-containing protein [Deltaproteobacteria bacterium]MBW2324584.1 DUF2889 domain-containing protein [Deltaproteobacteria bacterium]